MADQKAILKAGGKEIELPILSGTEGQDVIDVRTLGQHGYFTYDPGFMATGSCESAITYIDGAAGVLLHRGFPIEELAHRLKKNMKNSNQRLHATPWYMSKLTCSSMASATMPTLWQCYAVRLVVCHLSITAT